MPGTETRLSPLTILSEGAGQSSSSRSFTAALRTAVPVSRTSSWKPAARPSLAELSGSPTNVAVVAFGVEAMNQ